MSVVRSGLRCGLAALFAGLVALPSLAETVTRPAPRSEVAQATGLAGRDLWSHAFIQGLARPMRPAEQRPLETCETESPADGVQPVACKWKPETADTPVPGLPTPTPQQPAQGPAAPPAPLPGAPPTTPTTTPATTPSDPTAPTPPPVIDAGFRYHPPGSLVPREASRGRASDRRVYAPGIVFPLKLGQGQHAYMNSQIYGFGGGGWGGAGAAGGSECDPRNYDPMVQRDNYCEVRGWSMPMCPAGVGHQGQDIRPPTCKDNTWEVVAVADGVITTVTANTTLRLKGDDGTTYEYLHMHPASIKVEEGDRVAQGDVIGRVSKYMNGRRDTTYHLHFNVRQRVRIGEKVLELYVPVYSSLIAAYRKAKGLDAGIDGDGNLVVDARYEIGAAPPAPPAPAPTPPAPTPAPQPDPQPTPPAPTPPAPTPAPQPDPQPTPPAPTPPAPTPPAPTPPAPTPPAPTPPAQTPPPSLPEFSKPPAENVPPAPAPSPSWWQRGVDYVDGWRKWLGN